MNFVIANEKGGVGKSMLAINVAAGIQRAGYTVVLIDIDSTVDRDTADGRCDDNQDGRW